MRRCEPRRPPPPPREQRQRARPGVTPVAPFSCSLRFEKERPLSSGPTLSQAENGETSGRAVRVGSEAEERAAARTLQIGELDVHQCDGLPAPVEAVVDDSDEAGRVPGVAPRRAAREGG